MTEQMPPLRILVQPKAVYRPRYRFENNDGQSRAVRYIRGEDDVNDLPYPTVEIPKEWINKMQQTFYIRLTHVTVPNERVPDRCIHPYIINANDCDVIKDPSTNSLYFPVSELELQSGRKSLRFCIQKLTHRELKDYGLFRPLDSDETHEQCLVDSSVAKNMTEFYQLTQSQIRFSIAVAFEHNTQLPIAYACSSVYSQVITGT